MLGSYYVQAISKDAPHPAAARLWQEFLYSDEGQNLWLKGGARPVRADAMEKAGTIDAAAFARAAQGRGHAGVPDRGADHQGQGIPDRELGQGHRLTMARLGHPGPVAPGRGPGRPAGGLRITRARSLLGTVPFFAYVAIFLIIPTLVVVIGAFTGDGGFTLANITRARRRLHPRRVRPQHPALRGHRR